MHWKTVFDITQVSVWPSLPGEGLPFLAVILVIFAIGITRLKSHKQVSTTTHNTLSRARLKVSTGIAVVACIFGTLFSFFMLTTFFQSLATMKSDTDSLKLAYDRGECQVVEGTVEKFDPMPPTGHKHESFQVKSYRFEYSDFDLTMPGFHNAHSRGGPICEGLHVKIWFKTLPAYRSEPRNCIARIDVEQKQ